MRAFCILYFTHMKIIAVQTKAIVPPKDSLFDAIKKSTFKPKNGDVIAVSSKVVAIHEGRCVPVKDRKEKESLAKQLSEKWVELPYGKGRRAVFTITQGVLIRTAGIDESNGNGYYILWPENPHASAKKIQRYIEKEYGVKLQGVVVTDSYSLPLRRGASGFALGWSGISPIKDYRRTDDVFGRKIKITVANVVDALASACVLVMGESGAQTPLCIVRDIQLPKEQKLKQVLDKNPVDIEHDIFGTFLLSQKWKKGGSK